MDILFGLFILQVKDIKEGKDNSMDENQFARSGIRISNQKEVDPFLKEEFVKYGEWLRSYYNFRQRIRVYVKADKYITALNGHQVTGVFLHL